MNLTELPEAVQKLAELGDPWALDEDFKYRSAGIRREHVPALIDVVRSAGEWMVEPAAHEEPAAQKEPAAEEEELPPQFWLPMHAWRALGQMGAVEAAPAMLDALRLIDDTRSDMVSDIVQQDLPATLSSLGEKIIPALSEFIRNDQRGLWARLGAADALNQVGMFQPNTRGEVVQRFIRALEDYEAEDPLFNSFIISHLMDLKAVEAAELVEQVFASERIEEDVMGDWEDFQVGVGLLKERLTPPQTFNFDPFAGERTGTMDFLRGRGKEDKQTKKKRKQAKETRKKNRKHKKR